MAALLLLGLLAGLGSVYLGTQALFAPRARVREQLAGIVSYGYAAPLAEPEPTLSPLERLGARFSSRVGRARVDRVRKDLVGAGMYEVTPERWLGLQAACLVGLPLLMVWFVVTMKLTGAAAVGSIGFGAYAGYAVPVTMLSRRARMRLETIDLAVPELVDLLIVAVESGQAFGQALRSASDRLSGPLRDELSLVLQEQSLGGSMAESFSHFVERVDVSSTRAFARTLVQGERLGVSVGNMLRGLADELRKRRRAQAEEQAQKTPVKILFPLVLLIFPSMFIVLLGPAVMQLAEGFG